MGAGLSTLLEGMPGPVWDAWGSFTSTVANGLSRLDVHLAGELPSSVVLKTAGATVALCWSLRYLSNVVDHMSEYGCLQTTLEVLKALPIVSGLVAREKDKLSKKIQDQVVADRYKHSKHPKFAELPERQMARKEVLNAIEDLIAKDETSEDGKSKLSGARYFNSEKHANFQTEIYGKFVGEFRGPTSLSLARTHSADPRGAAMTDHTQTHTLMFLLKAPTQFTETPSRLWFAWTRSSCR